MNLAINVKGKTGRYTTRLEKKFSKTIYCKKKQVTIFFWGPPKIFSLF